MTDIDLATATVEFVALAIHQDGPDPDTGAPDQVPLQFVKVKLAPSPRKVEVAAAGGEPARTITLRDWILETDEAGVLSNPETPGVPIQIVASDAFPGVVIEWTSTVSAPDTGVPDITKRWLAPAGATVDLTTVLSVPPSPSPLPEYLAAVQSARAARDVAVSAAERADTSAHWAGQDRAGAEAARDQTVALRNEVQVISGLTGEDAAVALLVDTPASNTGQSGDNRWTPRAQIGWRSVKEWGVKGDGVTNDTPAMQQAVDDMAAVGGGTLYLPTGRYVIDAPGIKWATRVSLVGDGPGRSVLASAGTLTSAIWQLDGPAVGDPDAEPLEDVTFLDFEIDGSGLTHTEPSVAGKGVFILYMRRGLFRNLYIHDTIGTGLGCDFLADTTIENVIAENCGRNYNGSGSTVGQSGIGIGTHAWQVENVTVANCHTNFNGNHGIFVETQPFPQDQTIWPKGARITNCYAQGNRIGIANKGSGGVTFTGCEAVENVKYGFASLSNARDDLFVGCRASGNGENGFYVENTRGGVTISACQSFDNGSAGIAIRQSSFATWAAVDFAIGDCLVARNGYGGIMLAGVTAAIEHVTITGNHIVDNGQARVGGLRQGVRVEGSVSDLLVTGNWVGNSDVGAERTQVYAVHVTSGETTGALVADNMFRRNAGANAGGWFVESAATVTDAEVRDNHGVKDHARGTGTIWDGNATATVNHGLPTPPQSVLVTPKGGEAVWVDTIGAGGVIYRRAGTSGKLEFMWQAEV